MILTEELAVVGGVHVLPDIHLRPRGRRTTSIVIGKVLRQLEGHILVQIQILDAGHPVAVRRLVLHHEHEGTTFVPTSEQADALVRDQVGDVPLLLYRIIWSGDEGGVVVVALTRQDLPVVEALRERVEVPLADDSGLVSGRLEQLGEGLLVAVEYAVLVIREAILVRVLSCQETGA